MIVSQRDPKWSSIKLGTSATTIGGYGCTITCLGYLVGMTPDKVNERMNAVGGYASGNLVIWTKVQEAIGVTCYRYTTYDNAKVLEAIANNGACLAEVDAKAIGGTGKHWIVLVGNKLAQDPWFGEERPTSNYTFTGYTTVVFDKSKMGQYTSDTYRGYDLTNKDSMKVCIDDHIKVVEGQLVDKSQYEAIKGQLSEVKTQNDNLSSELGAVRGELATAIQKIDSQNKVIASFVNEDAIQLETLKRLERESGEYKDRYFTILNTIQEDLKQQQTMDGTAEAEKLALEAVHSLVGRVKDLEDELTDERGRIYDREATITKLTKQLEQAKKPLSKYTTMQLIRYIISRGK